MSSVDRLSWWNGWYQNSCCARGLRIRSPIPGSGGDTTSALTRSGRSRATAWAIRLPMSYPASTGRPSPSSPISAMMLRAWAAAVYWLPGSAGCRSDSPNPRRSGTTASTSAVTRGTTAR